MIIFIDRWLRSLGWKGCGIRPFLAMLTPGGFTPIMILKSSHPKESHGNMPWSINLFNKSVSC